MKACMGKGEKGTLPFSVGDFDGRPHFIAGIQTAQAVNPADDFRGDLINFGHLWQGRFFSSPLDEADLWAALRYVERKPVRARLVRRAKNYPWSSAAAHCGHRADAVLTRAAAWRKQLAAVADWVDLAGPG